MEKEISQNSEEETITREWHIKCSSQHVLLHVCCCLRFEFITNSYYRVRPRTLCENSKIYQITYHFASTPLSSPCSRFCERQKKKHAQNCHVKNCNIHFNISSCYCWCFWLVSFFFRTSHLFAVQISANILRLTDLCPWSIRCVSVSIKALIFALSTFAFLASPLFFGMDWLMLIPSPLAFSILASPFIFARNEGC